MVKVKVGYYLKTYNEKVMGCVPYPELSNFETRYFWNRLG